MWQPIRRIIFLLLLPQVVAATAQLYPNLCHMIMTGGDRGYFKDCAIGNADPTSELYNFPCWKNCTYDAAANFYGYDEKDKPLRLDFSLANEAEITDFFSTKPNSEKAVIKGGFIFVGNDNVETINFGNVVRWETTKHDAPFIYIRSNANLKRIIWNLEFVAHDKVQVLIYNNPLLRLEEDKIANLTEISNDESFIQNKYKECLFENKTNADSKPNLRNNFHTSQELLTNCRTIRDTVQLQNIVLPHDIILEGKGCLQLVNVDFNGYRLIVNNHTGTEVCYDHSTSMLLNNPHICGENMSELYEHIPAVVEMPIELDFNSCSKICTSKDALHPHYLCREMSGDAYISEWFRKHQFQPKMRGQKLTAVNGTLSIENIYDEILNLPYLTKVSHLLIRDNSRLKELKFTSLQSVGRLTITNNPELHFDQFPIAFSRAMVGFPNMDDSVTQCITTRKSGEVQIITSFEMIRICKRIEGPLKLQNIKKDSDTTLFQVTHVNGCISVENTELTSLYFLDNVIYSQCMAAHTIRNNTNACAKGYLTDLLPIYEEGYDSTDLTVNESENKEINCPCIASDLAGMGSVDKDCYTLHSYRNFSCHDYDVTATSKLVEIQGKLVLEDCTNLDRDFVNLKKIVGKGGGIPLIIYSSSAPPTLEFLKRIQFSFIGPPSSVLVRIDSTMEIERYLSIKYTYGKQVQLAMPAPQWNCYDIFNLEACIIFEGDLVVNNDELTRPTKIRKITGCLIVKNGTQLNFLASLKEVGERCEYGDENLYPYSPSKGHVKTTIQIRKEFCPPREERERLAAATRLASLQLNENSLITCSKACSFLTEGNCDSLYGDLLITPDVYVKNLEVIYGKLVIVGTLFEQLEFPRLKLISSPNAPAVLIHKNERLISLQMPLLTNITAANNARPLIKVTGNPNINDRKDFIPSAFLKHCRANPKSICYVDNAREYSEDDENVWGWNIALPAIILLLFAVPAMAYILYNRKREAAIEKTIEKQRIEALKQKRHAEMMRRLSIESAMLATTKINLQSKTIGSQEVGGWTPRASKRSSRTPNRTTALPSGTLTTADTSLGSGSATMSKEGKSSTAGTTATSKATSSLSGPTGSGETR